jgi:transposase
MLQATKRAELILTEENREILKTISQSQTEMVRRVRRAKLFLLYAAGVSVTQLAHELGISRQATYTWIKRALAIGPIAALEDQYHRPFEPIITLDAKEWVVSLACIKPKEFGYAAELWTMQSLADHARVLGPKKGYECLARACKATVWRILNQREIKPHKIKYYLERRDPEFESKQAKVLLVYQEVAEENAKGIDPEETGGIATVSVDAKPGIQAIGTVGAELPPVPGRHSTYGRDYEYQRFGTVSLLAGLDLHTGYIHANVVDRPRSFEFITFLRELDAYYPASCKIRLILDNHSIHTSKETMEWLATRPNRFEYVHTPKHGSWLNIIETLFSKMSRGFLKGMRVKNIKELKERILLGISEINQKSVVHRWRAFDL